MLNEQHTDLGRQLSHHFKQLATLTLRHAGRRLIEQQNTRLGRHGQGNFQQALLAIGQLGHGHLRQRIQAQLVQNCLRFLSDRGVAAHRFPPGGTQTFALANRQHHGLQWRQMREQSIDLKRAHQPHARTLIAAQMRDVLATEKNASSRRFIDAGEQVNQRGLARTIGANQSLARTGLQRDAHVFDSVKITKTDAQAFSLQSRGCRDVCGLHCTFSTLKTRRSMPIKPPPPSSTTAIKNKPIQSIQYSGFMSANFSCTSM